MAILQMSGGIATAFNNITLAIKDGTIAKIADKFETVALTVMYAKDFIVSIMKSTIELGEILLKINKQMAGN